MTLLTWMIGVSVVSAEVVRRASTELAAADEPATPAEWKAKMRNLGYAALKHGELFDDFVTQDMSKAELQDRLRSLDSRYFEPLHPHVGEGAQEKAVSFLEQMNGDQVELFRAKMRSHLDAHDQEFANATVGIVCPSLCVTCWAGSKSFDRQLRPRQEEPDENEEPNYRPHKIFVERKQGGKMSGRFPRKISRALSGLAGIAGLSTAAFAAGGGISASAMIIPAWMTGITIGGSFTLGPVIPTALAFGLAWHQMSQLTKTPCERVRFVMNTMKGARHKSLPLPDTYAVDLPFVILNGRPAAVFSERTTKKGTHLLDVQVGDKRIPGAEKVINKGAKKSDKKAALDAKKEKRIASFAELQKKEDQRGVDCWDWTEPRDNLDWIPTWNKRKRKAAKYMKAAKKMCDRYHGAGQEVCEATQMCKWVDSEAGLVSGCQVMTCEEREEGDCAESPMCEWVKKDEKDEAATCMSRKTWDWVHGNTFVHTCMEHDWMCGSPRTNNIKPCEGDPAAGKICGDGEADEDGGFARYKVGCGEGSSIPCPKNLPDKFLVVRDMEAVPMNGAYMEDRCLSAGAGQTQHWTAGGKHWIKSFKFW